MFNLIDVGERTGSGIPLIREAWRQMKWPEISANEEYGPERTTVRLLLPSLRRQQEMWQETLTPKQEAQQEVLIQQQETDSQKEVSICGCLARRPMKMRILEVLSDGEKSRQEISEALGQKNVTGRLNQCISELIASGEIERTLPDKLQSPYQKYRLTGKDWKVVSPEMRKVCIAL